MQTRPGLEAILGDVEHAQRTDLSEHARFLRHPIHAVGEAVAHARLVAARGDSAATPAIMAAAALAVVVPIVATLILLDFGIAHFA